MAAFSMQIDASGLIQPEAEPAEKPTSKEFDEHYSIRQPNSTPRWNEDSFRS